jgi:hypothetical protein
MYSYSNVDNISLIFILVIEYNTCSRLRTHAHPPVIAIYYHNRDNLDKNPHYSSQDSTLNYIITKHGYIYLLRAATILDVKIALFVNRFVIIIEMNLS